MKWLQRGIIGLLIGLSTSYVILTIQLSLDQHTLISGNELTQQLVIAAIMGIIIGFGQYIFELEKLSITIAVILHYFFVTICVLIAGHFGHWFDIEEPKSLINVMISQLISYVVIWVIIYALTKRDLQQLNKILQERREIHDKRD